MLITLMHYQFTSNAIYLQTFTILYLKYFDPKFTLPALVNKCFVKHWKCCRWFSKWLKLQQQLTRHRHARAKQLEELRSCSVTLSWVWRKMRCWDVVVVVVVEMNKVFQKVHRGRLWWAVGEGWSGWKPPSLGIYQRDALVININNSIEQ